MTKRLYVGNLGWDVNDQELATAFSEHGTVVSASVISDKETGRSRGFGFVEVEDSDAQKIIDSMNGLDWHGRPLTVSEAREREDSRGGGSRGGGYGGRGSFTSNRRY